MKVIIIALILILLSAGGYYLLKPKRQIELTPFAYAEMSTKMNLPANMKLIKFKNEWLEDITGDGERVIRYSIDNADIQKIATQCIKKQYKNLPIKEDSTLIYLYNKTDTGYYSLNYLSSTDKRNIELIILNMTKRELYIWLNMM